MDRNRITKLALLIVVLSFVLSTFVSLWSLRIMADNNMQELSRMLAARIYDSISIELNEPIMVARTMASDRFLIEFLEKEEDYTEEQCVEIMQSYLNSLQKGLGYESVFTVSDATKRYYASTGLNKVIDPEHEVYDQWYSEFLDQEKAYDLDMNRDEMSQDAWTVFVDARIEDLMGKLLGVCGVGVHMTGSQNLFDTLEKEYNVRICLADVDGLIQVDTIESNIQTVYLDDIVLSADQGHDYVYQKPGKNRIVVTKYIDKLGWYLVVQSDGSRERGQFIHVIMLNVVLCLLVILIMLIAIRIVILRTRALAHASFRDSSTSLLNRRAFEEKKEELAGKMLPEHFVYMTVDVNGLKPVNDTLGHAAGDEMIRGAADCLKQCFGRYGDIYRIGGDEFAAMLSLTEEQLKEAIAAFETMTANWSGEMVKSLSVSCGFASSSEFPSENLTELSQISDERMYQAKEAFYQQTGKKRRV